MSVAAMPPPLQIPPSRARRQFAMRLAQRKAQLENTREQEDDVDDDGNGGGGGGVDGETQEKEVKEGHERFAKMFEGIESDEDEGSSDEEGDEEGYGEKHGMGGGG
ncbi:hypothetical protein BDV95DRAFT_611173 [Massariosphaeria phaeospora]|uniref:Uncharacterized protein n=1 Tax=Massariosphaeria phaeospora TaxID=100035 RepID=A0A7C8I014_9PLEO|nr:hypothetical protein BDV95DRAFT_611173 [Massariosphaeria phaeospora]